MRTLLKPRPGRSGGQNKGRRGFALVITISLMVLLSMLAVGALVLSSSALRSAARGAAQAEAQANARMALALALGELQLQMGPDQRVSANAAILAGEDIANPHWTGVWDSWRAGEGEPSQHQTIRPDAAGANQQMSPTYAPDRQDYFRSWLVSLRPEEMAGIAAGRTLAINGSAAPGGDSVAVQLVGPGSLGDGALNGSANGRVSAPLIGLARSDEEAMAAQGRFGWWVGDESQKARIDSDRYAPAENLSLAQVMFRTQAPGSFGAGAISGLENLTDAALDGTIPSLQSLDLLDGAVGNPSENFHSITNQTFGIFTDVREGGLKRDLNTLLERRIELTESADEFMLYRFGNERVPIHDLAAYYQLYDQSRYAGTDESWRAGVSYNSNRIPGAIQLAQPDLGGGAVTEPRFIRQYQRMYKSSVPVKVQILVTMTAHPIPGVDTDTAPPGTNTHFVRLHMMPAITLWNPTNLPLVMNLPNNNNFAQQMRFMSAGFNINWIKNNQELNPRRPLNLSFAAMGGILGNGRPGWGGAASGRKATIFDMYFATMAYPIMFEPGEVRVFSYHSSQAGDGAFSFAKHWRDHFQPHQQAAPGWNPDVIFPMSNSLWGADGPDKVTAGGHFLAVRATESDSDQIAIRISTDLEDGTDYAFDSEWPGAAFSYMLIQNNHQSRSTGRWGFRNYPLLSRMRDWGGGAGAYGGNPAHTQFNDTLLRKGFPADVQTLNRSARQLVTITEAGEHWPLFQFSLMAAVETSESSSIGAFGGRKLASRPFLHSSPISPPHVDQNDNNSLYSYGLNWWIEEVNSVFEANVQVDAENRRGFFGGGYTPDFGTTHVVQQDIPVVPPLSVAALSHAHLGGFSLGNAEPNLVNPVISAVGVGGLFPFTLRAIGNSYAHPLLAPDQGFNLNWQRHFHGSGGPRTDAFADHSYLANKALWDEFFFSSITPQNASVGLFGSNQNRSALQVAQEFFFGEGTLPNRRLVPYPASLTPERLGELFAQADQFSGGLADQIAAHLMVIGPFNINSTSVDGWRALLSSMQGKPIAYLDPARAMQANAVTTATPEGVAVSSLGLPVSSPEIGSSMEPSDSDQWRGARELTDPEIDELAAAIVKQVKLRGPFLSLSEFVNRRLDSSNRELSVKGALQAAIDDPDVSINDGFRSPLRRFSSDEINSMNPAFSEALEGPVAYGSSAYVDQADILRNFAGQLTPRGDTFVIRTYGDSMDANGNVVARAWCEAVVQRVPDYVDSVDEPHVRQAELDSQANRNFGRKFRMISFRWLSPSEI